ncbi:hypothetical protein [Spirosoma aerolatum]|uniref:hypothetical protein n=1 Tax=Spirosoma aerolatum TaxID=1211326 RepID=UPI0009AD3C2E|nr:hypothetical protein [Spirosoma aerolatum]
MLLKQSIVLLLLSLGPGAFAQSSMKVANYAYGQPGTDTYEAFSFWVKNGKRTTIDYTYGKDRKETPLQFVGKSQPGSKASFTVQFPNRYTLYVTPMGNQLQVMDEQKKYRKTFIWQYEGPINGVGTFCDVCAQDEKEAMRLIQRYYLK